MAHLFNRIIRISLGCILSTPFMLNAQVISHDTTEQFFLKQLKKQKNISFATYSLAALYFNRGEYKKAISYAKQNLKKANDFDTLCSLIYAQSLDFTGRYSQSERVLRKATKRFPQSDMLWFAYGFSLYKVRKYALAEQALENSIRCNPFVPNAHYLLGYCLIENNNPTCLQAFLFGLMIDPDTLRSTAIIKIISHYQHRQFDSLQIPLLAPRLALKNPEQLFKLNNQSLAYFRNHFTFQPLAEEIIQHIESNHIPSLYNRFFKELQQENLLEVFCYYTFRNLANPYIQMWYKTNRNQLNRLATFLDTCLTKPF